MSNYTPLNVNVGGSAKASVGDAIVPVLYLLGIMALPAVGDLLDNAQLKVMAKFLALPFLAVMMARDPRFKIDRTLAFGSIVGTYVAIATIAGLSPTFKKAIEEPRTSSKTTAVLIWLSIMALYAMFIIVPVTTGAAGLYNKKNM
jgi:hypothetical protein